MILKNKVKNKTELIETGGKFRHEDFPLTIGDTPGTYELAINFPWDVNIIRGISLDLPELAGEKVNMFIGKNDIVGYLTASSVIGDNIFNVSHTVVDNLDQGDTLFIDGENLGEILDVIDDNVNSIYTIKTTNTATLAHTVGVLVGFCYVMVKNKCYYGSSTEFKIEGSQMYSFLPKGMSIYVSLITTQSISRTLPITLEFLMGEKID